LSAYHKNALRPGYALAEYTIESVLGHGGFGITYLARDNALGAEVAIKEYLPQEIAARDERTAFVVPGGAKDSIRHYHWGLKNFVKEARALARFKHPNIVRVLRFIEANGTAYTVMEYEQGRTLAQELKQAGQRLDEPALLRIVMPILNGLDEVHKVGLLHLDIKPENIYLRRDGTPMLIDFGSTRHAMTESRPAGRIALTHGYAPVEQYPDKGQLGPWSDVYALGATMYRCVTGKRPADALARYRAVLDYKADPLVPAARAEAGRYQPMVLESIDGAMQVYAKDRPQTAREFQDYLLGRKKRISAASPVPGIAPGRRERTPGRVARFARYVTILLMVAGLGIAGWLGWPEVAGLWRAVMEPVEAEAPNPHPGSDAKAKPGESSEGWELPAALRSIFNRISR